MSEIKSPHKFAFFFIFLVSNAYLTVNASVVGTHNMNFDNTPGNPTFLQIGPTLFGPIDLTPSFPAPEPNASILQDGIRTAVIGVGSLAPLDQLGTGHLHYTGNSTNFSRAMAFEADSGGASIYADAGSFSFQSMFFDSMNQDILVTGYKTGGGTVTTLISALASSATTIDFLALNSGFGNVTLIEMWEAATGRGVFGTVAASTVYDNIVIASPVPVPAALYLFATGLIGLVGSIKSKKFNA